jgi:hypothetical protein
VRLEDLDLRVFVGLVLQGDEGMLQGIAQLLSTLPNQPEH